MGMIKRIRRNIRPAFGAALIALLLLFTGCAQQMQETIGSEGSSGSGHLQSTEDIGLYDTDGGGTNYAFTYGGETFYAQYYYDNWTLFDSYKITDSHDMKIICQALIDVHSVHGRDRESFRTAKDMVYEWEQHNLAYKYLPEDNAWRESARNVDFDPDDQGRSLEEMYEARTGEELDIEKYLRQKLDDGELGELVKRLLE